MPSLLPKAHDSQHSCKQFDLVKAVKVEDGEDVEKKKMHLFKVHVDQLRDSTRPKDTKVTLHPTLQDGGEEMNVVIVQSKPSCKMKCAPCWGWR